MQQEASPPAQSGDSVDALRLVVQATPLGRWIWHEALFDAALFVCVLFLVVRLLGTL